MNDLWRVLYIEFDALRSAWRATMARIREPKAEQEPVGIVISSGSRTEDVPRFSAYVWGPAPVAELEEAGKMAAA